MVHEKDIIVPLSDRTKEVLSAASNISALVVIGPDGLQTQDESKNRGIIYTGVRSHAMVPITDIPMLLTVSKGINEMTLVWDEKLRTRDGVGAYRYLKVGRSTLPLGTGRVCSNSIISPEFLAQYNLITQTFKLPKDVLAEITSSARAVQAQHLRFDFEKDRGVMVRATDVNQDDTAIPTWTSEAGRLVGDNDIEESFPFVTETNDFRLIPGDYNVGMSYMHSVYEYDSWTDEEKDLGIILKFFISSVNIIGQEYSGVFDD